MANQSILNQDLHVRGTLSAERFTPPIGSIGNNAIPASAGIDDGKLKHRHALSVSVPGTIGDATQYLIALRFDGEVLSIEAAITEAVATGTDRTVDVDLQKSTGGGAFATVLSANIQFDNASNLREIVTGTLASAALLSGDMLRVVVSVAGSDATQAAGLLVTVNLRENAQ